MNRRNFWRAFWGLFLLAVGALWILNNFEVIDFDFGDAIALLLPMLLIAIGLLLLFRPRPSAFSGGTADKHIFRAFGDVKLSGENLDPNGLEVSTGFGDVELDLSRARFAEGENALYVHTAFGDVEVKVPDGVAVSASGGSAFGDIKILGQTEKGVGNQLSAADPNFESQNKRLRVHAHTAFGDIVISR
ncbi:MAG: cell wall-active antibiotics response protein LiaF [candidate division Zixibacteria bacterium]|nr:cell wall-active antibiotics response protein LiaF [candidate division Zixibacteria bacterium]